MQAVKATFVSYAASLLGVCPNKNVTKNEFIKNCSANCKIQPTTF